ncbi:MAG: hypothetical protein JXA16_12470 [Bacteroidales bacterium]|nr:hypothetical protein [Bacteroidales bacterium]
MLMTLCININNSKGGVVCIATKDVKSDLIPIFNAEIEDGVFKSAKKIIEIQLVPDENKYNVWLDYEECIESIADLDKGTWKNHGWEIK